MVTEVVVWPPPRDERQQSAVASQLGRSKQPTRGSTWGSLRRKRRSLVCCQQRRHRTTLSIMSAPPRARAALSARLQSLSLKSTKLRCPPHSGCRAPHRYRHELAAINIQSHFRTFHDKREYAQRKASLRAQAESLLETLPSPSAMDPAGTPPRQARRGRDKLDCPGAHGLRAFEIPHEYMYPAGLQKV